MSNTSTRGASATSTKTTTAEEMKVVHTFVKNSFDEVWTYLQPFKGHDLAHIRVFTLGDDDEMYPKKQGITVNVRDLPKLAEAVAALVAAVEARAS
jgi:Transcriptional Coactivator p15 (PC4)